MNVYLYKLIMSFSMSEIVGTFFVQYFGFILQIEAICGFGRGEEEVGDDPRLVTLPLLSSRRNSLFSQFRLITTLLENPNNRDWDKTIALTSTLTDSISVLMKFNKFRER